MLTSYKWLFLALFAGLVAAAVQAGRLLRERPEGSANQLRHELPTLKVVRPVLGLVFYGALFDWLIPGRRLGWAFMELSASVRWSGGMVMTAAVLIIWWSFTTLGRNFRGGVGLWYDHDLVTHGPYRWVRHPIYGAFVLAVLGVWALSANWLAGVSGLVLTVSIPAARLPVEERELEERFGERYEAYRDSTPRFIPWLW